MLRISSNCLTFSAEICCCDTIAIKYQTSGNHVFFHEDVLPESGLYDLHNSERDSHTFISFSLDCFVFIPGSAKKMWNVQTWQIFKWLGSPITLLLTANHWLPLPDTLSNSPSWKLVQNGWYPEFPTALYGKQIQFSCRNHYMSSRNTMKVCQFAALSTNPNESHSMKRKVIIADLHGTDLIV